MRHDPIRATNRVHVHPDWCGCSVCQPPAPSVRRDPSLQLLLAVPVGLAIGVAIGKAAGFDLAVQLALVMGS